LHCAAADWIVYLDDDTRVPGDFIEKALYTIKNFSFDCFGGVYLPWFKYGRPRWFREEYASNGRLLPIAGVLEKGYASGGVVAFNKEKLVQLGGFPTSLGMSGKRVAYGEENFIQRRLRECGGVIGFNPDWTVEHLVAEYKLDPWWFVKSKYAVGRDSVATYQISWSFLLLIKKSLGALFYLVVDLVDSFLKLSRKDYHVQNIVVETLGIFSWKVGQIVGASKVLMGP
jgi:GT2 family glycosyltransferase